MAVSYTHLDVYKRQDLFRIVTDVVAIKAHRQTAETARIRRPVSYTHLVDAIDCAKDVDSEGKNGTLWFDIFGPHDQIKGSDNDLFAVASLN